MVVVPARSFVVLLTLMAWLGVAGVSVEGGQPFSVASLSLEGLGWLVGIVMVTHLLANDTDRVQAVVLRWLVVVSLAFFASVGLVVLYVTFELALLPVLALIVVWGAQAERLTAASMLLGYTFAFSMPLLAVLFRGTLDELELASLRVVPSLVGWLMLLAFMVKAPLYTLHAWLLRAHVEAPPLGSIALAGVLLKLGTVGAVRVLPLCSVRELVLAFTLACVGSRVAAMATVTNSDVKAYVAFSSVAHINVLVAAVTGLSTCVAQASALAMVTHGVTSSALFWLAGLAYHASLTRVVYGASVGGGLALGYTILAVVLANFGVPPTLAFVAEASLLCSLATQWVVSLVVGSVVMGCCYYRLTLWLGWVRNRARVATTLEGRVAMVSAVLSFALPLVCVLL